MCIFLKSLFFSLHCVSISASWPFFLHCICFSLSPLSPCEQTHTSYLSHAYTLRPPSLSCSDEAITVCLRPIVRCLSSAQLRLGELHSSTVVIHILIFFSIYRWISPSSSVCLSVCVLLYYSSSKRLLQQNGLFIGPIKSGGDSVGFGGKHI